MPSLVIARVASLIAVVTSAVAAATSVLSMSLNGDDQPGGGARTTDQALHGTARHKGSACGCGSPWGTGHLGTAV